MKTNVPVPPVSPVVSVSRKRVFLRSRSFSRSSLDKEMGRVGGNAKDFSQGHFPAAIIGREMLPHLKPLAAGGGNDLSANQLFDGITLPLMIGLLRLKESIQSLPQLVKHLGPVFPIRFRNRSQSSPDDLSGSFMSDSNSIADSNKNEFGQVRIRNPIPDPNFHFRISPSSARATSFDFSPTSFVGPTQEGHPVRHSHFEISF